MESDYSTPKKELQTSSTLMRNEAYMAAKFYNKEMKETSSCSFFSQPNWEKSPFKNGPCALQIARGKVAALEDKVDTLEEINKEK